MRVSSCVLASAFTWGAVNVGAPAAVAVAATAEAASTSGPAVPLWIDWSLGPSQIAQTCRAAIDRANARVTALVNAGGDRSFRSFVAPFESIMTDLNDDTIAQAFLVNVSADKAVRDASLECNSAEEAFQNEVLARPLVYAGLGAAAADVTAGAAQSKLTRLWLVESERAGAGLSDDDRAEFVRLSNELAGVEDRFNANLANDATTISIDPAQTAGLPAEFVATLERSGDRYRVPVNESTVSSFLQNARDAGARRAYAFAYGNRGGAANVALLARAIALRDRLAHLFGYPSWAAYVLADRMAQRPQRVEAFLDSLDAAILPRARAELSELAALKGGPIQPWDVPYYQNELRSEKYALETTAINQYFPVEHTIAAVLGIYARLLGVAFVPIAHPAIYNPEVRGFEVHDVVANGPDRRPVGHRVGALLGTFYLDLYPRPGKYNHFANFPLIARRVLANGSVRAPLSIIVGNWSRPAPGQPALLSHPEVQTFFHEFGHNMAAMLAATPYATLNTGFRLDFVEAPSQMLENWAWDPGILKEISSNVITGQPLPDELIAKMVAARYVDYALTTTRQIALAKADLAFHAGGSGVDLTAVYNAAIQDCTPLGVIAGTHPEASFGHLMQGYDAGYYGYLWSKVYAQDLFTAFKSAGLEDPATGLRYRGDILAPARMYEPDAEVSTFLGRPMSPTAFYGELGITAAQPSFGSAAGAAAQDRGNVAGH